MVQPSCPVLVVHDDDAFRKTLIATLDQEHFTVTYAPDGDEAKAILSSRPFNVVLVGLNLTSRHGVETLDFLRSRTAHIRCGVIILGDSDPQIRSHAPWANETLLKPVDAGYVAARARTYCGCP